MAGCGLLAAGSLYAAAPAASPAEEKLNQGASALSQLRYDDAIRSFQECLDLLPAAHPLRASAYLNLGLAYANEGDYEKAISAFESSILANPRDPSTHLYLGRAFRLEEEPVPAVMRFLEAVKLDPGLKPAHDELWQAYEEIGERYGYDKDLIAREVYHIEKTLELDAEYEKAYPDILRKLKALFMLDRRLDAAPSPMTARLWRDSGQLVAPADLKPLALPDDDVLLADKAAAFEKARAR